MTDSKIRTAHSRNNAGPIRIGNVVFTPDDPRIEIDGRPVYLCRQELALLQLLAKRTGWLVSTATLARSLARGRKPLTDTGVAVYVHRLRARLKSAGVVIRTFRGFGYLLEPTGEEQAK
jgi:two-component system OmpR family response regulator